MTATENYWNTVDTALIDAMIFDKRDDLNCAGYIQYSPVLSEPHPDTPIPVIKELPVANAGPDQVVLTKITLDGSGSNDPYGSIVSYQWRIIMRNNPSFDKIVTGQTVTVPSLEYGFYDVTLTVTDNDNNTATDQMIFAATGPKFTGDINEDGKIGLEEAIHALQAMTRQ